jgi:methylglutaconyl-CoA hydratase
MPAGFHIDLAGGVARVVMDRPERHNAFDDALISGLTKAFVDLAHDRSVDCVVLGATGASFSAGADLGWMKRAAEQDRAANLADAQDLARLMRTLDELSKPTVAVVQGAAYGGGVGLIACCDIAIAAETAKFAFSEVRLGLIPAVISPYVVRAIGPRQARRYFQTGEIFGAAEAARIGLLHESVGADDLESRVSAILTVLRAVAPEARKAAKRLVADVLHRPIDDEVSDMTAGRIADIRARDEAKEGLSAFFERRKPGWQQQKRSGNEPR